jgi:hypothetical protein
MIVFILCCTAVAVAVVAALDARSRRITAAGVLDDLLHNTPIDARTGLLRSDAYAARAEGELKRADRAQRSVAIVHIQPLSADPSDDAREDVMHALARDVAGVLQFPQTGTLLDSSIEVLIPESTAQSVDDAVRAMVGELARTSTSGGTARHAAVVCPRDAATLQDARKVVQGAL